MVGKMNYILPWTSGARESHRHNAGKEEIPRREHIVRFQLHKVLYHTKLRRQKPEGWHTLWGGKCQGRGRRGNFGAVETNTFFNCAVAFKNCLNDVKKLPDL